MKLVKSLVVAFVGTLVAACSVTDDAGTDGGTDSGKTDTLVAPGDTLGSDTLTPPGDGGGGDSADAGSCATCATAACGSDITACNAEPACKSGLDCFNACTTKSCKEECLTNAKNPDGTAGNDKFNGLITCVNTSCKSICGLD